MLCYATMLCCAVLLGVVLKCATGFLTVPYHTIPYHTIPYHTIPYHTIPYHTIPYHTIPCLAMLCCAVLCCAVLCCAVLCCAVLCCVFKLAALDTVLCCAMPNCVKPDLPTLLFAPTGGGSLPSHATHFVQSSGRKPRLKLYCWSLLYYHHSVIPTP